MRAKATFSQPSYVHSSLRPVPQHGVTEQPEHSKEQEARLPVPFSEHKQILSLTKRTWNKMSASELRVSWATLSFM